MKHIPSNTMESAKPVMSAAKAIDKATGLDTTYKRLNFVAKLLGKGQSKSIAKLGSQNILQFPVIMSRGIVDISYITEIAKALERQFAFLFMLIIQNKPLEKWGTQKGEHDTISSVLSQYHQTKDTTLLNLIGSALTISDISSANANTKLVNPSDNVRTISDMIDSVKDKFPSMEHVEISASFRDDVNTLISLESMLSLYADPEDIAMSTESLNDLYLPFQHVESILEKNAKSITTEAINMSEEDVVFSGGAKDRETFKVNEKNPNYKGNEDLRKSRNLDKWDAENRKNQIKYGKKDIPKITSSSNTGFEPTVMEIEFSFVLSDRKDASQKTVQKIRALVGVKTMVSLISANEMVENCTRTLNGGFFSKTRINKVIKGDLRFFRDFIFHLDTAREDLRLDKTKAGHWFNTLKKRSRHQKFNDNLTPIASLVLTTADVEEIKNNTSIDLMTRRGAKNLMDKLFLLALVIVDPIGDEIHILLDNDDDFHTTRLRVLQAGNKQSGIIDSNTVARTAGIRS